MNKESSRISATLAVLFISAAFAGGVYAQTPSAQAAPIATAKTGQLRGSTDGNIHVFKGIPYGAPTGGANRFKLPQPPESWKGMRGAPVYLYRMEWQTPVNGGRMRAHHALDLPLMFDNVDKGLMMVGTGAADAQRVADAMSAAWLAFARTGNQNAPGLAYWPAFNTQHQPAMAFNAVSRAVADPIHDVRLLLENPPAATAK